MPIIYWVIPNFGELIAPYPEANLVQEPNDLGDPCHYDLRGLSDNQAKDLYSNNWRWEDIFFCQDENIVRADEQTIFNILTHER